MALTSVRIRMARATAGADPVYWEWAVDGATHDDTDGLALVNSSLQGLENGVTVAGSGNLCEMNADLIELFPGGGGPAYFVQGLAPGVIVGTGNSSIHVIQCAVNELVNSPRGVAVRGRMFVGPIVGTTGPAMPVAVRDFCVGVMQEMADQHITDGYTPVVISKFSGTDAEGDPIPRVTPEAFPVVGFRADQRLDILVSRRVPSDTVDDFPLTPA